MCLLFASRVYRPAYDGASAAAAVAWAKYSISLSSNCGFRQTWKPQAS